MSQPKKTIWRYFNPLNSKLFRSRNVIVVSEGEVKHYPISSRLQLLVLLTVMGGVTWGSYSTGSYFAAQSILEEKERKIETTTLVNRRIEEQYGLLRRDLDRLQSKDSELSEYERFVLSQHSAKKELPTEQGVDLDAGELTNISQNLLQDRIDYLEGLVEQLKTDRETLVGSIRERTKEQITAFKDIIDNTGLRVARLTKTQEAKAKAKEIETANAKAAEQGEGYTNQGGPYVPENPTAVMLGLEDDEQRMVGELNEMLLLSEIIQALPLSTPLREYRLTSPFGRRVDPITKRWALHKGLDFVGDYGDDVVATAAGTVTHADRNGAYGYMVEIDHGYGLTTRYAHLKKILVAEGDAVDKGDVVGLQGNSGRSTGTHLHYEVRFNRAALNPKKFIEAGSDVF